MIDGGQNNTSRRCEKRGVSLHVGVGRCVVNGQESATGTTAGSESTPGEGINLRLHPAGAIDPHEVVPTDGPEWELCAVCGKKPSLNRERWFHGLMERRRLLVGSSDAAIPRRRRGPATGCRCARGDIDGRCVGERGRRSPAGGGLLAIGDRSPGFRPRPSGRGYHHASEASSPQARGCRPQPAEEEDSFSLENSGERRERKHVGRSKGMIDEFCDLYTENEGRKRQLGVLQR